MKRSKHAKRAIPYPVPGETEKMTSEEISAFYLQVHRQLLATDRNDHLSAVIHPGASKYLNAFSDYAHRLGMKKAFSYIERGHGSLANRPVLDLGCGRGRWSKEYAARGARVTGVDISPEAIRVLATDLPEHTFLCSNLSELSFSEQSFDVINSVTVLQHIPNDQQQALLTSAFKWLKPHGYLVLLENVSDFEARFVFPHSTHDWINLVEQAGLQLGDQWDSNYEVLFRWLTRAGRVLSGNSLRGEAVTKLDIGQSFRKSIRSTIDAAVALPSFLLEWCCHKAPIASATHSVMVFQKPGDESHRAIRHGEIQ